MFETVSSCKAWLAWSLLFDQDDLELTENSLPLSFLGAKIKGMDHHTWLTCTLGTLNMMCHDRAVFDCLSLGF